MEMVNKAICPEDNEEININYLLSESSLIKDWLRAEEDKAWENL